jgi:D-inositol-3-phosphate glycosyltransferase
MTSSLDSLRIAAVSLHTSPLAVPGSADAGGMNVVVLEQARALAAAGHQVDVFTRRSDRETPEVVQVESGLRVVTLDAGPSRPLAKSAMEQAIDPFSHRLGLALDEARTEGAGHDLIHSHHWFSGVAALPHARRLGIPHLQSFHSVAAPSDADSLQAGERSESAGRIPGERSTAQDSDLVVAVSEAAARSVHERYDVSLTSIEVVPPGVDTTAFHPSRRDAEERITAPALRFAARLQPLKAPDLAIDVLARLDPALDARLLLVGSDSEDFDGYREQLEQQVADAGLSTRVEFLGPLTRPEIAAHMRDAAVVLVPSWSETFGLVALEAESSGTPVVAWTHAGGVREAVGTGSVLLGSRDPDVWAEAVEGLVRGPEEYHEAARSARAFAETRTWVSCADSLARLYSRVLR